MKIDELEVPSLMNCINLDAPLLDIESESEPFVWPPTASSLSQEQSWIASTHSGPLIAGKTRPNAWIESIETHLLGRTGLAFDIWASRTGWKPDTLQVYCWRCGGSIGDHESDGEGCASCRGKSLPWDRAIRLGKYKGVLRSEILGLKFHRWRSTGTGLGKYLGLSIAEHLKNAQIQPAQAVLVPIPMHRFRRITRGVDHTQVIAKSAANVIGCQVSPMLATRYRPEQVGLSMTARAKNIKDAFSISKHGSRIIQQMPNLEKNNRKRVYILIDDVRTTGATLVAACKPLKTAFTTRNIAFPDAYDPPKIWTGCIGVAGESRRDTQEVPI